MKRQKGFTLIEVVVVLMIAVVALIIAGSGIGKITGIPVEYSNGERTGVVNKISKKGFVFKTWEGEMQVGVASGQDGGVMTPVVWSFSLENEAVAQEVANNQGKRVTLKYKEMVKTSFVQAETDYLVYEVIGK